VRVGPYQVLQELGQGGMARVFLGHDPRADRQVAIKVLLEANQAAPQYRTRFLREARALAKVEHPNVVRLFDLGEHQGTLYIALAYHARGSLGDRLSRAGPLPVEEVLRLGRGLASGISAAHAAGVLHRDLKPDNVLLGEDGLALLTDFGLAKDLGREGQTQDLTKSGTLQGTPGYWAPEQARGTPNGVGPWTDVYGLGAILYAALSGRAPFVGEGLLAILAATEYQAPPPLRSFRRDVPPALESVVLRCLEKDPQARWASAAELESALESCPAGGSSRPLPWAMISLAGAGLALGGSLVFALDPSSSQTRPLASPNLGSSPTLQVTQAPALASPAPHLAAAEEIYLRGRAEFARERYQEAAALFREAAEANHPAALNAMGLVLTTGQGGERDAAKAADYFGRSAELGYPRACLNLAVLYERGQGVKRDQPRARALLRRALEGDPQNVDAALNLGIMFYKGLGGPESLGEGVRLLRQAAEAKRPRAMRYLADAYMEGRGVEANHPLGVKWLLRGAKLGEVECMIALAQAHQAGQGTPPNPREALRWLRKAADKGHPRAAANLGMFYEKGVGTAQSESQAARWYSLAAERGDPLGMYHLGVILSRRGGRKNLVLARAWYRKAAEKGSVGGMYRLGVVLAKGEGGPPDEANGLEWLSKAAERGHTSAMFNLGILLSNGEGIEDRRRARGLYEKAAELGHVNAMLNFAIMLDAGQEGPMDKARALALFKRSAAGGDAKAMLVLGRKFLGGDGVALDVAKGVDWLQQAAQGNDPVAREEAKIALQRLGR
jgi:uncharacterized protein